eukprot:Colp12_sorted_trinity150504_noHs@12241
MMARLVYCLSSARHLATRSACKAIFVTCTRQLPSSIQAPLLQSHLASGSFTRSLATFHNRPSLALCAAEFPEVVKQWHPHKNMVGPESVAPFSAKRIWFLCDE